MVKFIKNLEPFVKESAFQEKLSKIDNFLTKLKSDPMSGWVDLPVNYDTAEFSRIKSAAQAIVANSEYLVCIGIGGSYLGHKAVIEALGQKSRTKILYAGNSLSAIELKKVLRELGDSDFSVNVISKSGTTTEPAIAFRIFKQKLIEKYGETEARRRIYATTDQAKGALHDEAVQNSYQTFVIPDNIGGRYSVLTAVGLLPIAVSGINIDELMQGAATEREQALSGNSSAATYAAARNCLYESGYDIEVLSNFEPSFAYFNEWWKQLFGESEGKDKKGIFPASLIFTTDLHSMGQYMQDGRRNIFETFVQFSDKNSDIFVPLMKDDTDGLKYLEGKSLDSINSVALEATVSAHLTGGVPVLRIELDSVSAKSLGSLIYFFELSVALSGYLLGVNPFNQPGVEEYKTNMFRLLEKPGF